MTLEEHAGAIPHMGARNIGANLAEWARRCKSNIVECGSWLGSGTAYLAIGARESGAKMHVYDKWRANDSEIDKAAAAGFRLTTDQDTLPLVRNLLEPFGVDIAFHKGGIADAEWTGDPIGLFVLDAAKRNPHFQAVTKTFFPFLEDGAVVVLMDFHHYERGGEKYRDQARYIEAHPEFEMIHERLGGDTSAAVFVYHKPAA